MSRLSLATFRGRPSSSRAVPFHRSHLVEELVDANEVRVLDDFSSGQREWLPDGISLFEGDILNHDRVAEAMAGVDLVYHEAAQISVACSVEDSTGSHARNVNGTLTVLEAAPEIDARVGFASIAALYGDPDSIPIPEDPSKRPRSPYGLEKLTADRYARLYNELYDLETEVLRYFNVYRPRQSGC